MRIMSGPQPAEWLVTDEARRNARHINRARAALMVILIVETLFVRWVHGARANANAVGEGCVAVFGLLAAALIDRATRRASLSVLLSYVVIAVDYLIIASLILVHQL